MGKGRKNKVLKLTAAKVKYIIRAKTDNTSSKIIAAEMKVSIRTVNRVWSHWMRNKEPWVLKKFGRPKKSLSESDIQLILKIHKELNSRAKRIEKISKQKYGRHILTPVHLNWHTSRFNGKESCGFLTMTIAPVLYLLAENSMQQLPKTAYSL